MTQTTVTTFAAGNFAANRIGVRPPALVGLSSWVFPRLFPAPANLISGGPALINVGAGPTLQSAWGNFTYSSAAYNSGVVDTPALTLMTVAQSPGGGNGFSLFSNETPNGLDWFINQYTNNASIYVAGCCSTSIFVPLPGGSILNWAFYALTIGSSGINFYCPTAGIAVSLAGVAISGTPATGNTVAVTAIGGGLSSPHTTTYTLISTDTTAIITAASLAAAINADATMAGAGITAYANYVASVGSITLMSTPGSGITYTVAATGGGAVIATTSPTATHLINSTATLQIGSTVSGGGRGGGSIAWFAAANGIGAQANSAQIQQTYQALKGSLALDGVVI